MDKRAEDMEEAEPKLDGETPFTDAGPGAPLNDAPFSQQLVKSQRILACVLCHQRKIKCNRKFPCNNCTKTQARCEPAMLAPRRRRRKIPPPELVDQLRVYESLLRANNIKFDHLRKYKISTNDSPVVEDADYLNQEKERLNDANPAAGADSETVYEAKNYWYTVNRSYRDNDSDTSYDDVRDNPIKTTWDLIYHENDQLLFGARQEPADLSSLHPNTVQIFRLCHLFIENVNPLLQVVHAPSLQSCIIEAADNVLNIEPNFEALMFGIYSMAVASLTDEDCINLFGTARSILLQQYHRGSQEALLNARFLRTDNRNCLTALFLHLLSIRPKMDPRSVSSMLGIALRTAQRIGLDNESDLAKCDVVEAEMRRRLWWALVLFDTRICELIDTKKTALTPTWDCRIPLNVNESELRTGLRDGPRTQTRVSDSIFVVVRGVIADFIRHSSFYLNFTNPAMNAATKTPSTKSGGEGSEVDVFEKELEEKYLQLCDPEIPLQFMTIWTARGFLAKYRIIERLSTLDGPIGDAQRDALSLMAVDMIACDSKIMTSPIVQSFLWLIQMYHFPFTAYIQLLQDLKRRPASSIAAQAWSKIDENYTARLFFQENTKSPFYQMVSQMILQSWDARQAKPNDQVQLVTTPGIVSYLKSNTSLYQIENLKSLHNISIPIANFTNSNNPTAENLPMKMQDMGFDDVYTYSFMDLDPNQLQWLSKDWD
ncbi:transcriptional regulator family: Fungal Specific TF [Trichoderma aggressivum f. europaeum]|uniref:Transcriptional regulator family: Fungal Specific TF n=1 Tax=Trichoderma aggressivum f. europaeum TaxID=173218 RepID=A0AAE1M1I8_9HYPO|nr:transcriptional regulator family: Fungal Specific TF [Trichoderma aggressivum f. europaeum]